MSSAKWCPFCSGLKLTVMSSAHGGTYCNVFSTWRYLLQCLQHMALLTAMSSAHGGTYCNVFSTWRYLLQCLQHMAVLTAMSSAHGGHPQSHHKASSDDLSPPTSLLLSLTSDVFSVHVVWQGSGQLFYVFSTVLPWVKRQKINPYYTGFYTKGLPLVKYNLICPSDKLSWRPGCPVLNNNIQGKFCISQGNGSLDNLPENLV